MFTWDSNDVGPDPLSFYEAVTMDDNDWSDLSYGEWVDIDPENPPPTENPVTVGGWYKCVDETFILVEWDKGRLKTLRRLDRMK